MHVWLPTIRARTGADVFGERLAGALQAQGIEVTLTWLPHAIESWPIGAWRLAPKGADIVHANANIAFAFTGHGVPVVATDHGSFADEEFVRTKPLLQRLYHQRVVRPNVLRSARSVTGLTAVSKHIAVRLQERSGRSVTAIPNWVDTTRFVPASRDANGDADLVLLYAGSASFQKGFDIVRRLASLLDTRVKLLCSRTLERQFNDDGGSRVSYFDPVDAADMPGIYARADAVLMPSRYEGFGYVALEAMACGLPVVGFKAIAEVCGSDAALLCEVDDIDGLCGAVHKILDAPELRARMGAAGRSRAVEVFKEQVAANAYIDIYNALAGR